MGTVAAASPNECARITHRNLIDILSLCVCVCCVSGLIFMFNQFHVRQIFRNQQKGKFDICTVCVVSIHVRQIMLAYIGVEDLSHEIVKHDKTNGSILCVSVVNSTYAMYVGSNMVTHGWILISIFSNGLWRQRGGGNIHGDEERRSYDDVDKDE